MKCLRFLIAIALACGFTGLAGASTIDFTMSILDPPPQLSYTLVDGTAPFAVSFGVCPPNIVASGCFTGFNETTSVTFTNLSMVFANTTSVTNPTDYVNFLNGQTPNCITTPSASLFSSSSCVLSPNLTTYQLDFFNGIGIKPGTFFFITETGPTPGAFGTGQGTVGVTPEPSSILLLSTGILMAGLFFIRQRGRTVRTSAF